MIGVPAKRSCSSDTFLGFRHEKVSSKAFLCQTQPELAGFLWKQAKSGDKNLCFSRESWSFNTFQRLLAPLPQVLWLCQRRRR